MNVFDLRQRLVDDYADYTRSFVNIRDERINDRVEQELHDGLLWCTRAATRSKAMPRTASASATDTASFGRLPRHAHHPGNVDALRAGNEERDS